MSEVSDLLALSMRAHKTAHAVRHNRGAGDARALMVEAQANRLRAHDIDPTHVDPAWSAEESAPAGYKGLHARLVAYYEKSLA